MMLPAQFSLGPLTLPSFGFFAVLSFVVFSFLLWRSLREDYPEEEIITLTITLLLFSLLAGRLFYWLEHFSEFGFNFFQWLLFTRYPGFSLLGAFGGGAVFTAYFTHKKAWDFWLVADNLVYAGLVVFSLAGLGLSLTDLGKLLLAKTLLAVFVLGVALLLGRYFRKFIWYRSGKPGFVACVTTALFFLGTLALDFWAGIRLYWVGGLTIFLVLLALVFLYRRSDRLLGEDLTILGKSLGILKKNQ